jgi:hypothetical protein
MAGEIDSRGSIRKAIFMERKTSAGALDNLHM